MKIQRSHDRIPAGAKSKVGDAPLNSQRGARSRPRQRKSGRQSARHGSAHQSQDRERDTKRKCLAGARTCDREKTQGQKIEGDGRSKPEPAMAKQKAAWRARGRAWRSTGERELNQQRRSGRGLAQQRRKTGKRRFVARRPVKEHWRCGTRPRTTGEQRGVKSQVSQSRRKPSCDSQPWSARRKAGREVKTTVCTLIVV